MMGTQAFVHNAVGTSGLAESGALLRGYVRGTTTPQTVYTNSALTVPASHPYVANAAGHIRVYYDDTLDWTFVVRSANDANTLLEVEVLNGVVSITYADPPNLNGYQEAISEWLAALAAADIDPSWLAPLASTYPVNAQLLAFAGLTMEDGDLLRSTGPGTFEAVATEELVSRQPLELFGCVGDGVTDDTTAFNLALASGVPLAGTAGNTYYLPGQITWPAYTNFNGNGCSIRLDYESSSSEAANFRYPMRTTVVSPGTINTVTAHSAGSRTITIGAGPSDLSVGDEIYFVATNLNGRWPAQWRTITGISGNDVTLDAALEFAYGGTVTCRRIPFQSLFQLENVNFICDDVENGGESINGILRVLYYRKVQMDRLTFNGVDIKFEDPGDPPNAFTNYLIYIDFCLDVVTDNIDAPNCYRGSSIVSVFRFRTWYADKITWSGSGFGLAPVNGDYFELTRITGFGQFGTSGSSDIRFIRPIGCLKGSVRSILCVGYDSGVKPEDCANLVISDAWFWFTNTPINMSDQNPSSRSGGHHISKVHAFEYTGNAIALGTAATGDGLWQTCFLSDIYATTSQAGAGDAIIIRGGTVHASKIDIGDWASGESPFRTVTADGQTTKGSLSQFRAAAPDATGRLGVDIQNTHTGFQLDYDMIACNAPAGKFLAAPTNFAASSILAVSSTFASHTGDTSETTLATVSVPAGALGTKGFVRIQALWTHSNNGNNKTPRIKFGGTTVSAPVLTTNDQFEDLTVVKNQNSAASQRFAIVAATNVFGSIAGSGGTATVNTAAAFDITFTAQLANAGDVLVLQYYMIELVYVP